MKNYQNQTEIAKRDGKILRDYYFKLMKMFPNGDPNLTQDYKNQKISYQCTHCGEFNCNCSLV